MSSTKEIYREVLEASNRRSFLRKAGIAGMVGAIAPGLAPLLTPVSVKAAQTPSPDLDLAILNFALNLEYLEAQYYTYAVSGTNIESMGVGTTGGDGSAAGTVTVKTNPQVPFTNSAVADYAAEIAQDERNHVAFLRGALGAAAVAQPALDLQNSFIALGQATKISDNFDPFANDLGFLLGAFIFEDVGVSAYHGAAPLIYDVAAYIPAAAGILSVEGFHAAEVRSILFQMALSQTTATNNASTSAMPVNPIVVPIGTTINIFSAVQAISDARDSVDSNKSDKDQGIQNSDGTANIVPTDSNGLAFARTTNQVLRIVYNMATGTEGKPTPATGSFFPSRMNGAIS